MRVTSLGFRTDVALRVLEGAQTTDRGGYLVVRTPDNPDFYWGNFLLLGAWPGPGTGDGWLARVRGGVPAGPARRARRGCRGRPRRSARGVPGRGAGTRARHGAHLRRRPATAEPEHRGRDPPAGLRRRLAAVLRAGRPLLRRGRALPGATGQGQGAADR